MDKMMSVQVKESPVRDRASFLGKVLSTVRYGERVSALSEQGSWMRIAVVETGKEGWMHASALTAKKIVWQAGAEDVDTAASNDELALAGKGFNAQVEETFRQRNPGLDFTWIDRMEAFAVSPEQMARFVAEGDLTPEGGVG